MDTAGLRNDFRKLPLRDDFMFGMVMRNPDICQMFLEKLLGISIDHVKFADKQKDLSDSLMGHGIRLDVYLKDSNGTVYNVEMQTAPKDNLERRIRFYQSGIDREELPKGVEYKKLSDSYIIFVCDFDYYKHGLAVYQRESYIKDVPGLRYEDGSHVFILNSKYREGNACRDILEFLDYIRENNDQADTSSDLMEKVHEAVSEVRSNQEMEGYYMTLQEKLSENFLRGVEQGVAEGIARGIQQGVENQTLATVRNMVQNNISPEIISVAIQRPLEETKKLIASLSE